MYFSFIFFFLLFKFILHLRLILQPIFRSSSSIDKLFQSGPPPKSFTPFLSTRRLPFERSFPNRICSSTVRRMFDLLLSLFLDSFQNILFSINNYRLSIFSSSPPSGHCVILYWSNNFPRFFFA